MPGQLKLTTLDSLREHLNAVAPEPQRSSGIPPACYADEALLHLEQRAVFRSGWVALGLADRWPECGDYSALDVGGVPLIVVRNKAGQLKAFANSCRHRSSALLHAALPSLLPLLHGAGSECLRLKRWQALGEQKGEWQHQLLSHQEQAQAEA